MGRILTLPAFVHGGNLRCHATPWFQNEDEFRLQFDFGLNPITRA
jgi:hypothetical protein